MTKILRLNRAGWEKRLIAVFNPAAVMWVPCEWPAGLAPRQEVLWLASYSTWPPENVGRNKRRNDCCFLSILQMLDISTNYQHNIMDCITFCSGQMNDEHIFCHKLPRIATVTKHKWQDLPELLSYLDCYWMPCDITQFILHVQSCWFVICSILMNKESGDIHYSNYRFKLISWN